MCLHQAVLTAGKVYCAGGGLAVFWPRRKIGFSGAGEKWRVEELVTVRGLLPRPGFCLIDSG